RWSARVLNKAATKVASATDERSYIRGEFKGLDGVTFELKRPRHFSTDKSLSAFLKRQPGESVWTVVIGEAYLQLERDRDTRELVDAETKVHKAAQQAPGMRQEMSIEGTMAAAGSDECYPVSIELRQATPGKRAFVKFTFGY